jgi:hypothetical protein
VCPYPQIARYRGAGNQTEAANFFCADPGAQKQAHGRRRTP